MEVREVDNSWSELQEGAATLKEQASVPGTAWAIDPRTNKLQVTADSTVTGENWDTIESTVKSLGTGMATIKKSMRHVQDLPGGRRRHLRRWRTLLGRLQRRQRRRRPGLPDRRSLRCRRGRVVRGGGRRADRHGRRGDRHVPRRR